MALLLIAAGVPPIGDAGRDPLRDKIVASARAVPPAKLSFERTTRLERKGGGSLTRQLRTERWDGARWTLVSIDGHAPSERERRSMERRKDAENVPGYHELARIVAAATERRTDAQGRTVLVVPVLPAGSVMADGKDISAHLQAEAVLGSRSGEPWVERLTVTAREPFKLNLLIKVTSFEQINNYRISTDGEPRLVAQQNDSVGSMFGYTGGEKSEVLYAYR
ncbi:hypothetical protein [Polymorphobacter sp.]|uniref:hypothetical protein n=1 Tax=Polymorphobacter sp. TaxID=1909290 RepID=UPI003F70E4BB